MAQKRFFNWKDNVNSFELDEQFNGILQPGRYRGFDNMTDAIGIGINVDINHLTTGHSKTIENGSVVNNLGVAMMPNGTIVHETATIPDLAIDDNLGVGTTRIDFIIAEHDFTPVIGGTAVTYSILKGPVGGAPPTIANPDIQIEIGRIVIAANGSTFGDLISYTPANIPMLSNEAVQSFRDKLELLTLDEITALSYQKDLYKIAGDDGSGKHTEYDATDDITKINKHLEFKGSLNGNFSVVSAFDGSGFENALNVNGKNVIWLTTIAAVNTLEVRGILPPDTTVPTLQYITIYNATSKPIIFKDSHASATPDGHIIFDTIEGNVKISPWSCISLFYDNNNLSWVIMNSSESLKEISKTVGIGTITSSIFGDGTGIVNSHQLLYKKIGNSITITGQITFSLNTNDSTGVLTFDTDIPYVPPFNIIPPVLTIFKNSVPINCGLTFQNNSGLLRIITYQIPLTGWLSDNYEHLRILVTYVIDD